MKAKVRLTKRITLEINDTDEMKVLNKAITLSNPPYKCSECDSKNIKIVSNKDQDNNVYVDALCLNCTAKAKLGQLKSGGYFWHRDFKKYKKKEEPPPPDDESGEFL